MLTVATSDLFNDLDKSVKPVAPMQFWMVCILIPEIPYFSLLISLSLKIGFNFCLHYEESNTCQ